MHFTLGNHVTVSHKTPAAGIVSEIVPSGALPRTVHRAGLRPRATESYVVTILTKRQSGDRRRGVLRHATLGCRRIWPDAASLQPRTGGLPF